MGDFHPEAQVKGFAGFSFIALICNRLCATSCSVGFMMMNYSVCFEDKRIGFVRTAPSSAPGVAVLEGGDPLSIAKVLQIVENNKELWIISSDPERDFRTFCDLFTRVEAAGGLVTDTRGRVLLIFRNGRWDLPKGHVEQGEGVESCALREVEEETGLRGVTLGTPLARTLHFYNWHGVWTLKTCHWYRMSFAGTSLPLVPQQEEGITRAEWIESERLPGLLAGSFRSIREVFVRAGYLDRE